MKLVIVESPTKARTLTRFLGGTYEVMASMGHVRDLPKSKMSVDVEHDFKPEYEISQGKGEVIKKLKKAAKKANEIYLSMDPDREGEAIAYHVKRLIGGENGRFKRVVFHQITQSAIESAFSEPRGIDLNLFHAQQARRVLDRLVGYTLSPVLWKKVRRGLSAGRVQSVAVRLVVERERERETFKAREYWEIGARLYKDKPQQMFTAMLLKINDKKAEVESKKQAEQVVTDLNQGKYKVAEVVKSERERRPFPPFTTSTLQQAAANVLGFTAKRTMSIAQQLYEQGQITYHRTDSLHLAEEAIFAAREYINKQFGKHYLPAVPRRYKAKSKLAQEAHEAIRPTRPEVNFEQLEVEGKMASEMQRLYKLIWKRFMASQMSSAVYDQTRIDVRAVVNTQPPAVSDSKNKYLLRASGSIRKFDGWRKLYKRSSEDKDLPELAADDPLNLEKVVSEQKFTEPPSRYTDASLVKALEERGIGRPSTYAPTISTILARQYVEYEEKKFVPTVIGITTNDFLVKNFQETMEYDFTAQMEENLDKIAQGKREWVPVIREFFQPFKSQVSRVEEKAERVKVPTEATGNKCPKCGAGEEVIRVGRFGKFISCSKFPDCDYTANYVEKIEGVKCPEDGADVVVKRTRKGKTFYGCGNYPKCKWASWQKPAVSSPEAGQSSI